MILNPIIPIWLMLIISILIIGYIIKQNKKINKKSLLRISVVIILFIINLRPMLRTNDAPISANNLNVLFVIDTTLSMNAEDMPKAENRLEQVKKDCEYIMKKIGGANYSLITFDNKSKIITPFTTDSMMIKNFVKVMKSIDEMYANGSELNVPQSDMLKTLKKIREKNDNLNIVFYMSDGELTKDAKLKSYSDIKEYVDNGAVLGYGTEKGGYMQYVDYNGKKQYVTYYDDDYRTQKGVSKMDEGNLKQIAKDINVEYVNMEKQSNIDSVLKDISKSTHSKITDSNQESYDDLYFIFVPPLTIILFLIYKEYKEEYSLWKK